MGLRKVNRPYFHKCIFYNLCYNAGISGFHELNKSLLQQALASSVNQSTTDHNSHKPSSPFNSTGDRRNNASQRFGDLPFYERVKLAITNPHSSNHSTNSRLMLLPRMPQNNGSPSQVARRNPVISSWEGRNDQDYMRRNNTNSSAPPPQRSRGPKSTRNDTCQYCGKVNA